MGATTGNRTRTPGLARQDSTFEPSSRPRETGLCKWTGGDSNPNLHGANVASFRWTTSPGPNGHGQGVKESNPPTRVLEARSPPWRTPFARGVSDGSRTRLRTVTACPRPGRVRSPRMKHWVASDPWCTRSPHPDSNRFLPFTGRLLFQVSFVGLMWA